MGETEILDGPDFFTATIIGEDKKEELLSKLGKHFSDYEIEETQRRHDLTLTQMLERTYAAGLVAAMTSFYIILEVKDGKVFPEMHVILDGDIVLKKPIDGYYFDTNDSVKKATLSVRMIRNDWSTVKGDIDVGWEK